MAGLAKFIFCDFMDRDEVEVNKHVRKERGQCPAILTEQAWSILEKFSCGTQRVIPSGQDSSILPTQVDNQSAGFGSSCPLTELSI